MIRKPMAIAGLAVLGVIALSGPAQAYTAPSEADLRLQIEPGEIRLGALTPFRSQDLMPGTEAQFSVTAPSVTADHIPLTVTDSAEGAGEQGRGNIETTTTDAGSYSVGAVLPKAETYTVTSEGTDRDGQPSTLTFELAVGPVGGGGVDGLSQLGYGPLIGGAALAALGAGFFVLARRRHDEDEVTPAHAA